LHEEADSPAIDDSRGRIDPATLALQLGLLLFVLFAGIVVLGAYFREDALFWSRRFVETLGGPGILIGLLVPDALPIPLPHDAFLTFGLIGGLGFWTTVAWGGVGSIGGGVVSFYLGRWLATTRLYAALVERLDLRAHHIVERYGMIGLGLSTVTPIPYGACCLAVGALGMSFRTFFLVIQFRWLRVAGYLWIIEAGFLGVSRGWHF
jgi:membrane protein YqaA with SNARE-associated domain